MLKCLVDELIRQFFFNACFYIGTSTASTNAMYLCICSLQYCSVQHLPLYKYTQTQQNLQNKKNTT